MRHRAVTTDEDALTAETPQVPLRLLDEKVLAAETRAMPQTYDSPYSALGLNDSQIQELLKSTNEQCLTRARYAYGRRLLRIFVDHDNPQCPGHRQIYLLGLAQGIFEDQYMFDMYQDCARAMRLQARLNEPWCFLGVETSVSERVIMTQWHGRRALWEGYQEVGGRMVQTVLDAAKDAMLVHMRRGRRDSATPQGS